MGVTWSRHSFNLCVAPSYRNQGVLLFQKAGVNVCPEMRCRVDGELRIQVERVTEIWLGILVNYKLKFNYLSVPAYIQKRNGDEQRSNKQISLIMVILLGDYVQLTMGRNRELMDRNGVQTEAENNGQKQGMDRNGETRTEAECGEKRRIKDRSRDAGNGSEGWECGQSGWSQEQNGKNVIERSGTWWNVRNGARMMSEPWEWT